MEKEFKYNDIMRFVNDEYKKLYAIEKYDGSEKTITIPETHNNLDVYEIGNDCFERNELIEEVILPTSVRNVGSSAFSSCKNLKIINLDNISYIDVCAFSNTNIEKVTLNNIAAIEISAFKDCENLKEVIINGNIKQIESETFANCKNLKKVILPDTIEKIDNYAFSGCEKIEEIYVPSTAKIRKSAFENSVMELIKSNKKETEQKNVIYDLDYLLNETEKMKKEEIKLYIKKLLEEHKLDSFDPSDITDMNDIGFDPKTGKLTWKCYTHGYCTCDLWDLLAEKGKMIDKFNWFGCGYCG